MDVDKDNNKRRRQEQTTPNTKVTVQPRNVQSKLPRTRAEQAELRKAGSLFGYYKLPVGRPPKQAKNITPPSGGNSTTLPSSITTSTKPEKQTTQVKKKQRDKDNNWEL